MFHTEGIVARWRNLNIHPLVQVQQRHLLRSLQPMIHLLQEVDLGHVEFSPNAFTGGCACDLSLPQNNTTTSHPLLGQTVTFVGRSAWM